MAPKFPSNRPRKGGKVRPVRSSKPPPPEISIDERPAGRATLSAILKEMQSASTTGRKPFVTIGYDEKPLGEHNNPTTPLDDDSPEVTVSETRPGFETMAIIDEELLRDARELSQEELQSQFAQAEVLELLTFVILDRSLSTAATLEERNTFVAERLWHRLPPGGVSTVRRIDIRPADDTALMMRVWCAVPRVSFK